jgi:hypothetical protein
MPPAPGPGPPAPGPGAALGCSSLFEHRCSVIPVFKLHFQTSIPSIWNFNIFSFFHILSCEVWQKLVPIIFSLAETIENIKKTLFHICPESSGEKAHMAHTAC